MVGSALKASVLTTALNQNETSFYFPSGTWCSIFEPRDKCFTNDANHAIKLSSKAYNSYAHLRAGYIIPYQDANTLRVKTIHDLQQ
jgi:hypothetical protein